MTIHITRRVIVLSTGILLVGATVAYALRPEVIDVDTRAAIRGPLRVTVDEDGKTRVKNRFVLTSPVAGRLERITLKEGSRVSRNEVVAWIAPLPLDSSARRAARARLDGARAGEEEAGARVQQATVALDLARSTETRKRALLTAGAASPEEFERAAAETRARAQELSAARSHLRSARAAVVEAQSSLSPDIGGKAHRIPLRAPVDGQVLRIPERSERVVTPGTPVIEFGNARSIEVIADVLSSDAVRIEANDPVEIVEWGGDSALHGKVESIEPAAFTRVSALGVEEQRVNIVIEIPNPPASLGDGFRVEARVIVWESPSVLTIPSSAVFQRSGNWEVFAVENGRVKRRRVEAGHRNAAMTEIKSGISAGERVILFPSDKIDEDVRVREHLQG